MLMYVSAFLSVDLIIFALKISVCRATEGLKTHVMFCQYDLRARQRLPAEKIPFDFCTDILVGFFAIDETLETLVHSDDQATLKEVETKLFPVQKADEHVRIHLTLGTPDTSPPNRDLQRIVPDAEATKKFIDAVTEYLLKSSYYGVNIYWEAGGYSEEQLVRFVKKFHDKFSSAELVADGGQKRRWAISLTLMAFPVTGSLNDEIYSIHNYIDYLIVKAFTHRIDSTPILSYTHPQYLRQGDEANEHLYYLDQTYSVNWWEMKGFPRQKLVAGYPTYARALMTVPKGTPIQNLYPKSIYNKTIVVSRGEACQIYQKYNESWKVNWDHRWMAKYMVRKNGRHKEWLFYGGKGSVRRRCQWLLNHRYSGMMVWTLDQDDIDGVCGPVTYKITRFAFYCLKDSGETITRW